MSKNANSVRFCKQIPLGIYERFAKYAAEGGMDEREAFIALVNQFTPKLRDEQVEAKPAKPVDPQKRYAELVKKIKPFVDKSNDRTITRRELVIMDEITNEIRAVKLEMGIETPEVNRVADFDQRRADHEATINHMESELDQLQAISRARPLDPDDQYRVKELLTLIPQAKRELEINYPL